MMLIICWALPVTLNILKKTGLFNHLCQSNNDDYQRFVVFEFELYKTTTILTFLEGFTCINEITGF